MTNTENARKLVESIEAHRDAFKMSSWAWASNSLTKDHLSELGEEEVVFSLEDIDSARTTCGTTLCIAGFAAMHEGWKTKFVRGSDAYSVWIETWMVSPRGEEMDVDDVEWEKIGAEFLGLDPQTASRLFHYVDDNRIALEALRELANGEDPEIVTILKDSSNHCPCAKCAFSRWYSDDQG